MQSKQKYLLLNDHLSLFIVRAFYNHTSGLASIPGYCESIFRTTPRKRSQQEACLFEGISCFVEKACFFLLLLHFVQVSNVFLPMFKNIPFLQTHYVWCCNTCVLSLSRYSAGSYGLRRFLKQNRREEKNNQNVNLADNEVNKGFISQRKLTWFQKGS